MGKVTVAIFSVSLDGFGAGPRQDFENPLGVRGLELHHWAFETEAFKKMMSQNADMPDRERFRSIMDQSGAARGIDNNFLAASFENVGAYILGRNMFGPVRGPWKGDASGDDLLPEI